MHTAEPKRPRSLKQGCFASITRQIQVAKYMRNQARAKSRLLICLRKGKRERELRTGNHLSRPHRSPADVAVNPTATRTAEFLQTDIALCPRESLLLKLLPFQFTIFTFLFVANEMFCLLQPSLVPEECLAIEDCDTHSKEMH